MNEDARISNVDAERHLLGAIFTNPEIAAPVLERTTDSMFYDPKNRAVYRSIKKLVETGKKIHEVGVYRLIEADGATDLVELHELNDYINCAATSQTWKQDVDLLAEKEQAKTVHDLGIAMSKAIVEGTPPRTIIDQAAFQLGRLNGNLASGDNRFMDSYLDGTQLLAADIPKPRSLLGDGLLTAGSLMVLHGKPGLGKTWALLQLAVALASGRPWFGIPTQQCRVAIIEMEMHAYFLQERIKMLCQTVGDHSAIENIDFITKPYLRGPVDLLDEDCRRGIATFCRQREIEVLELDALSRFHCGMEREMGMLVAALDRLREESGSAIAPAHHERKTPADARKKDADDDMDAARGGGELLAAAHSAIRFKPLGDMVMMKVHKINLGPSIEPLILKEDEHGVLHKTEAKDPETKADFTTEKIKGALVMATDGCTLEELEKAGGVQRTAVFNHCRKIGAVKCSDGLFRINPSTDTDIPF